MNHWLGTTIYLALFVVSMAIRVPHDKVSKKLKISESRKGALEKVLLSLMAIGTILLPILSLTPILSFANHQLSLRETIVGAIFMLAYLWLFHRSHSDLGKNWSVTLEIREEHAMVAHGVYKYIRHPMYAAIYLMAIGQLMLVANWIAGPASLVAFTLMFACRLSREEQMMLDKFGPEYEKYRGHTARLIPYVW